MKKIIVVILALILALGGSWLAFRLTRKSNDKPTNTASSTETLGESQSQNPPPDPNTPPPKEEPKKPTSFEFKQPKKSNHFVNSTPAASAILDAAPKEVVITFDADLGDGSTIAITKDNKSQGTGETTMSDDHRSLISQLAPNASSGTYTVTYRSCWPDGTCPEGQFQFGVR